MKHLVVLGGGTAGTMVVNKLRPRLPAADWKITVVDETDVHYYQPGFLFIPFGLYTREDVVKPRSEFIPEGVDLIIAEIDKVDGDAKTVTFTSGDTLEYDYLVIATGTHPRPDQTPGLETDAYGDTIHDFYTLEGAEALAAKLETWEGGRLVVNIIEMPIKCPVAPLEFTFLAEAFFEELGMRDRVEITYVTPLPDAFTKPVAASAFGNMLGGRKIKLETDFYLERVDDEAQKLVSYDEREIPYDILTTIPVNMGSEFIARSGLGNELNHVPVDKHTFLSAAHENVFVIGDAADLPTSKAGSVAHFAVEVFTENFLAYVAGRPMTHAFDGHANCFIETGHNKGMLIDFNYDVEPLPGKYPLPGIGPFSLLKETEMNHWGKLLFKWTYWNMLLPGRPLPLPHEMVMAGKYTGLSR
jgi:sulfide:quinone oxidoreductase